jgi:hypothetical protein
MRSFKTLSCCDFTHIVGRSCGLLKNLTQSTIIRISVVLQFTTALTHKDSSQSSPWNMQQTIRRMWKILRRRSVNGARRRCLEKYRPEAISSQISLLAPTARLVFSDRPKAIFSRIRVDMSFPHESISYQHRD